MTRRALFLSFSAISSANLAVSLTSPRRSSIELVGWFCDLCDAAV